MNVLVLALFACGTSEEPASAMRDVEVAAPVPTLVAEAAAAAARAQAHEAEEVRAAADRRAARRASSAARATTEGAEVQILRGNVGEAVGSGAQTLRPFSGAHWLQGRASDAGDLLVVFWEPWCPACREELPKLQAWGGEGVVDVVAVTTLSKGATEASADAALRTAGFRLPAAAIPDATAAAVGATTVPYAVLLRDRSVVWKGHPGEARRTIRALLR